MARSAKRAIEIYLRLRMRWNGMRALPCCNLGLEAGGKGQAGSISSRKDRRERG